MKYEVGDLVRVFGKGKVRRIVKISQVFGYRLEGDFNFYISEELEPVTHITTKEFIKLVEGMEYEVDVRIGVIFIKTKNFIDVGWVRTDGERCAAFNFECDKSLLDIFYLYASTPLELREEKEQLYTLQCPETDFYYGYANQNKKELIWRKPCKYKKMFKDGIKVRENVYMLHFTQQEIDNLPNQEFIKKLIKKEVEND